MSCGLNHHPVPAGTLGHWALEAQIILLFCLYVPGIEERPNPELGFLSTVIN